MTVVSVAEIGPVSLKGVGYQGCPCCRYTTNAEFKWRYWLVNDAGQLLFCCATLAEKHEGAVTRRTTGTRWRM